LNKQQEADDGADGADGGIDDSYDNDETPT